VVEEFWDCATTAEFLGVNMNNLRQLQHRGSIKWKKREGKAVFYIAEEVRDYKAKREARKQR